MKDFDRWYELVEDKLIEEYEETKNPIDWDEFVVNKFEEFTSEIEDMAYDSWKNER